MGYQVIMNATGTPLYGPPPTCWPMLFWTLDAVMDELARRRLALADVAIIVRVRL